MHKLTRTIANVKPSPLRQANAASSTGLLTSTPYTVDGNVAFMGESADALAASNKVVASFTNIPRRLL